MNDATIIIRAVEACDTKQITEIYNHYIINSTATFEMKPIDETEMLERINGITAEGPYFVCENDGEILGYCYAHRWKARAAYRKTYETTVYISPKHLGKGLGTLLMRKLISECSKREIHALIACITQGNEASEAMHRKLGFKQASHFEEVGEKFGKLLGVADYELII
jgi:L-amino acid N-acyltransferase YncA